MNVEPLEIRQGAVQQGVYLVAGQLGAAIPRTLAFLQNDCQPRSDIGGHTIGIKQTFRVR